MRICGRRAASRVAVTDYPARGALEIITGYRVLEPGEYALEVELMTGRTHQIARIWRTSAIRFWATINTATAR
ncbi:MAG: hypothetical protein ACLS6G_06240 [Christensenellales bacterium]